MCVSLCRSKAKGIDLHLPQRFAVAFFYVSEREKIGILSVFDSKKRVFRAKKNFFKFFQKKILAFSKTDRGICYNSKTIYIGEKKMKNKSIIILQLYRDLLSGKGISVNECLDDHGLSLSTFYRYMDTLRQFLRTDGNISITYDSKNRIYKIKSESFVDDIE